MDSSGDPLVDWMVQIDAQGALESLAQFQGLAKEKLDELKDESAKLNFLKSITEGFQASPALRETFLQMASLQKSAIGVAAALELAGRKTQGFEDLAGQLEKINELFAAGRIGASAAQDAMGRVAEEGARRRSEADREAARVRAEVDRKAARDKAQAERDAVAAAAEAERKADEDRRRVEDAQDAREQEGLRRRHDGLGEMTSLGRYAVGAATVATTMSASAGFAGTLQGQQSQAYTQLLNRQVASIFAPLVEEKIKYTAQFTSWLAGLNEKQRESIRTMASFTVAMTAMSVVVPRVARGLGGLLGVKVPTLGEMVFGSHDALKDRQAARREYHQTVIQQVNPPSDTAVRRTRRGEAAPPRLPQATMSAMTVNAGVVNILGAGSRSLARVGESFSKLPQPTGVPDAMKVPSQRAGGGMAGATAFGVGAAMAGGPMIAAIAALVQIATALLASTPQGREALVELAKSLQPIFEALAEAVGNLSPAIRDLARVIKAANNLIPGGTTTPNATTGAVAGGSAAGLPGALAGYIAGRVTDGITDWAGTSRYELHPGSPMRNLFSLGVTGDNILASAMGGTSPITGNPVARTEDERVRQWNTLPGMDFMPNWLRNMVRMENPSSSSSGVSPVPSGFEEIEQSYIRINEAATKANLAQSQLDETRTTNQKLDVLIQAVGAANAPNISDFLNPGIGF